MDDQASIVRVTELFRVQLQFCRFAEHGGDIIGLDGRKRYVKPVDGCWALTPDSNGAYRMNLATYTALADPLTVALQDGAYSLRNDVRHLHPSKWGMVEAFQTT